MKKIILFIFLFGGKQVVSAQSGVDTLLQKLSAEKDPNNRVDLINQFLANTSEVDPVLDMKNAQAMLLYAQKNNDKIVEAFAISQIGYDYRAFGNSTKSLEYGLRSSSLARKTGNAKLISYIDLNLAHNYKDQADYEKASLIYRAVVDQALISKDYLLQYWAFNSISQVYQGLSQLDSALMYAQRAYELRRYDPNFLAPILQHLARVHGKMGNKTLALSYFEMAINEGFRTRSPRWINDAFTKLAEYYQETNQVDSSLTYAKKAIASVQNTPFSNKNIKAAKLLLDIYEDRNSDSAIKYFKVFKAANDSLFSAKTIQQTQLMKFEDELSQQELAKERSKAEEERKMNTQYAAIAIGLILFVSLFLLLSRSIIVNEKWISFLGILGLLIVFEFINLFFHPYIAKLTNHSPVLMLFVLVAIAALLIPLHHRIEHWIKHKMVEKNKKIRLEAAKKTIEKLENKNS